MKPGEHKTVQGRILAYAQEVGWTFVSREEWHGFDPAVPPADRARNRSLFFDDLHDAQKGSCPRPKDFAHRLSWWTGSGGFHS